MTRDFTFEWPQQRVSFGVGKAGDALADELGRLGTTRPMLIAGGEESALANRVIGDVPVALRWDEVVQHVPRSLAERARVAAEEAAVDVLVSIGGGSATGLAKAVALETGLPIIAIPTTYAGSEATNVWGLTDAGAKQTGVDARVLPVSVIYDGDLLRSLPAELSVASGLNALAHSVDALWAPNANPLNAALVLEGARALRRSLPAVAADPDDPEAREDSLYGCYLAAVGFTSAGSAMHHKICHVLGGALNLPHAQTHAVVLPYVLAFNATSAPEATSQLASALSATDASPGGALDALLELDRTLGAPRSLSSLGMAESDIERVIPPILQAIPQSNPAPVDEQAIRDLLRAAYAGDTPTLKEKR